MITDHLDITLEIKHRQTNKQEKKRHTFGKQFCFAVLLKNCCLLCAVLSHQKFLFSIRKSLICFKEDSSILWKTVKSVTQTNKVSVNHKVNLAVVDLC